MKKVLSMMLILSAGILLNITQVNAQSESKRESIKEDSEAAIARFLEKDPSMQTMIDKSYGYVVFPNIGKGGWHVGGAAGQGAAYEQGRYIGHAKMLQINIGFQFGGQAYRQIVFFETKEDMERFKNNNFAFAAQASAVAAASGAAANAKFKEGVKVFTMAKGGLMYEASIGGQKFKYLK